ncbi:hypothetical protein [Actinocorallia aurantiaca]|uniref:Uncharacterized protein n=1 Tax=Actinocorallia aurantiaca TaxID=46204 RepID=A0ABP6GJU9_9ACTN
MLSTVTRMPSQEAASEKTAERFTADGRRYLTGDAGNKGEQGFFRRLVCC